METIRINKLIFEVRRSKRRSTLGITIDRDGTLIAAVPHNVALSQIENAVKSKLLWVYIKLSERKLFFQPQREFTFTSGEVFHYLGRSYLLKLIPTDLWDDPSTLFRFHLNRFILRSDESHYGSKHLSNWYINNGKPWFLNRAECWVDRIGVELQDIEVRDLGYRWGSCNSGGKVNFHWRALFLPPAIIDYIIVHELVHLHEPLHNPNFWRRVKRAMPDFAFRKQWLALNGGRL
jgi:predicted metal-dependent hydrolase